MSNSNIRHLYTDTLENIINTKNYIRNAFASENTSGWATYADAAGTTPVNGTGGSPSVTFTRNTTSPLRNDADFLLTKDAVNRQGQGASYDFTIDSTDKGKSFSISFDYSVSANFVAGGTSDVQVFIYDVTNSQLVIPSRTTLLNSSGLFVTNFQSNSTSTQYRLILHVASTSALAYTMHLTSVQVYAPNRTNAGPIISDWIAYDMTPLGDGGTNPTKGTINAESAYWRRVGDSMELNYSFRNTVGGTNGTGDTVFTLPTGYLIDFSKASSAGGTSVAFTAGNGYGGGGVNADRGFTVLLSTIQPTGFYLVSSTSADNGAAFGASFFGYASNNTSISFHATVPIQGWTSQVAIANSGILNIGSILQNGTRVTGTPPTQLGQYRSYLRGGGSTVYTETNGSPSTSPTASDGIWLNTASSFASSDTNNQPSLYEIFIGINKSYTINFYRSSGHQDGVEVDPLFIQGSVEWGVTHAYDPKTGILRVVGPTNDPSGTLYLTRYIVPGGAAFASTLYFDVTVADNDFQIQLQGTQTVACRASGSAPDPGTNGKVVFSVKDFDPLNMYNTTTGDCTVPYAGIYLVCGVLTGSTQYEVDVYIDGVFDSHVGYSNTASGSTSYSGIVRVLSGQKISVHVSVSSGAIGHTNLSVAQLS